MNKSEREQAETKLADLKGRAEHFHELGNETVWDAEIERLEKLLEEKPKPKKAGVKNHIDLEDLSNGS